MESTDVLGLGAIEMCLVPGVVILSKFKVPDFEKYKGSSDLRTHIRAYCRKMAALCTSFSIRQVEHHWIGTCS